MYIWKFKRLNMHNMQKLCKSRTDLHTVTQSWYIYSTVCVCFYIHIHFTLLYTRSKLQYTMRKTVWWILIFWRKIVNGRGNFLCIEDQWRMQWPRHSPVLWTGIPYTDKKVWGYFFLIRAEGIRYKLIFAEMREHFDLLYMSKLFLNPSIRLCKLQPNPVQISYSFSQCTVS